jgi:hypothetical protein
VEGGWVLQRAAMTFVDIGIAAGLKQKQETPYCVQLEFVDFFIFLIFVRMIISQSKIFLI